MIAKEMIIAPVGSNHQAILAPAALVKIPNLFERNAKGNEDVNPTL